MNVNEQDDDCTNAACHTEILQLQGHFAYREKEIQQAKQKYHEALVLNLKKDVQMEQLEEQSIKTTYKQFQGTLQDKTIDELKSLDGSQKSDSKFVLTVVKDLYRNDLLRLQNKTFSGRKKESISPEKMKILRDTYNMRMNSVENNKQSKDK